MSRFLATYHGSDMPADPQLMAQAKAAFQAWVEQAGPAIVDAGAPVRTVTQVSSGAPMAAAQIGGYSIIEAETPDAAATMLEKHPYVGRGGTLQVNQILEV
jgi:uncharacterized protein (DUF302 family)